MSRSACAMLLRKTAASHTIETHVEAPSGPVHHARSKPGVEHICATIKQVLSAERVGDSLCRTVEGQGFHLVTVHGRVLAVTPPEVDPTATYSSSESATARKVDERNRTVATVCDGSGRIDVSFLIDTSQHPDLEPVQVGTFVSLTGFLRFRGPSNRILCCVGVPSVVFDNNETTFHYLWSVQLALRSQTKTAKQSISIAPACGAALTQDSSAGATTSAPTIRAWIDKARGSTFAAIAAQALEHNVSNAQLRTIVKSGLQEGTVYCTTDDAGQVLYLLN